VLLVRSVGVFGAVYPEYVVYGLALIAKGWLYRMLERDRKAGRLARAVPGTG